jgi:hypothetical protein
VKMQGKLCTNVLEAHGCAGSGRGGSNDPHLRATAGNLWTHRGSLGANARTPRELNGAAGRSGDRRPTPAKRLRERFYAELCEQREAASPRRVLIGSAATCDLAADTETRE